MSEALKTREEGMHGGGGAASAFAKIGSYPRRWMQFYHDVRAELAKVVWPSRKDVISMTVVVTITVAFFGVFFLGTDSLFSWLRLVVVKLFMK